MRASTRRHNERHVADLSPILRSVVTVALAFALCLALAACAPTAPSEPAGITGTVTSLVPGDDRPASILVEGVGDKAQVRITPQTLFFDASGKSSNGSAIVVGATVKVWFKGPVAESFPVQGTAGGVQIVNGP